MRKNTFNSSSTLCDLIISEYGHNPFLILISCLLSLRSKDSATIHVCHKLFSVATTPEEILKIPDQTLKNIIKLIGFHKTKASTLKFVSKQIINNHNGKVPNSREELLAIKGIGIKTTNLVLGLAYNIPAICVDIHVHRISNRLGLINTKTPEETERALQSILPRKYWIEWNRLLITWGQNICMPVSPFCSKCAIKDECKRIGVTKNR